MIKKLAKITVAILILLQAACATIATEPRRSNVELKTLPKPKYATCSVSFVHTQRSSLDSDKIEILPTLGTFLYQPSIKAFEDSGVCGKVVYREAQFVRLDIEKGKDGVEKWLENYVNKSQKEAGADLTVNFYFHRQYNSVAIVSLLMVIPSFLTFGMFPIWAKENREMLMTYKEKGAEKFVLMTVENSFSEWYSTLFWLTPWRRDWINGDMIWEQKTTLGTVKSGVNGIIDFKTPVQNGKL